METIYGKEIIKLKEMLEDAGIPFEYNDDMFGDGELAYQILIFINDQGGIVDAVCHKWSYGHNVGLLEIMGGLTIEENDQDSVLGYQTAEEVFKRFKYCYENNTTVYKEE